MWRVIGQERAIGFLRRALESQRFPHAWLFVGPRHVGKLTLALDLACALNCRGEEKPCGSCSACQRILSGNYPDVQLIERRDKEIGIAQIRGLQQWVSLKPYEGGQRVFIINGAEYLSEEASNCFLKVLEEPPAATVFILLAETSEALLPTIVSRCQRIELRPLPLFRVKEVLREKFGVDELQAELLGRLSQGRLGWAISALRDRKLLEEREARLKELLRAEEAGLSERFALSAKLAELSRERVAELLRLWAGWWRDLLLIKSSCEEFITNLDLKGLLHQRARLYTLPEIGRTLNSFRRADWELEQNANPRLVLEVLMLDLPGTEAVADRSKS